MPDIHEKRVCLYPPPSGILAGMRPNWTELSRTALAEVQTLIRSLPREIRAQAESLAVLLEQRPPKALINEGIAADTLGIFEGPSLRDSDGGATTPPHIILYLANLWDFSRPDVKLYRAEIRTTYLHELGHYLGLDESDLEARALD